MTANGARRERTQCAVLVGGAKETWVRGASVTSGYLDNPGATAASFADGWFRSGGLATQDADGYVFIKGRLKEVINRGEIDAPLLTNAKVLDAASFGEADPIHDEDVHAAVILRPSVEATEDELRAYCQSVLSCFEVPDRIHIVTPFPCSAKGSTDRRALGAQFSVSSPSPLLRSKRVVEKTGQQTWRVNESENTNPMASERRLNVLQ